MRLLIALGSGLAVSLFAAANGDPSTCPPPQGEIVFPEPTPVCYGYADLPLPLIDTYTSECGAELTRDRNPEPRSPTPRVRRIEAYDAGSRAAFGRALAADGDTLLVGAPFDDLHDRDGGSVHVFEAGADGWTPAGVILPPGERFRRLGWALTLQGDTAAVAATDCSGAATGPRSEPCVLLLERTGDSWVPRAEAPFALPSGGLHLAVALDGDTLIAANASAETVHGRESGVVYVYRRIAGEWTRTQRLVEPEGGREHWFGGAVALAGGRLVVGAPLSHETGRLYFYEEDDGGRFVPTQTFVPPLSTRSAWFGAALDFDGSTLVVGAPRDPYPENWGEVVVLREQAGGWDVVDRFRSPRLQRTARFGNAVALDGARILVGVELEDTGFGHDAGAAYLFEEGPPGRWSLVHHLPSIVPADAAYMGKSVAIAGPSLIAGVPGGARFPDRTGMALVFEGPSLSGYRLHGDRNLRLRVTDALGQTTSELITFTIDLWMPRVDALDPFPTDLPWVRPYAELFRASDFDGARGDVVHERLSLDGCVIWDGDTFGDRDGLLGDEVVRFDRQVACEAMARCDLPDLRTPLLRVEATDCAGNVEANSSRETLEILRDDCE